MTDIAVIDAGQAGAAHDANLRSPGHEDAIMPIGEEPVPPCQPPAIEGNRLAESALIVREENAAQIPSEGFVLKDARRYGDTPVTVLQRGDQ